MNYKIIEEDLVYTGFLKVKKARMRHDLFDSTEQIEITRECLMRGDSVAVLIYESDTDSFLFVNQFRYPTTFYDSGWILEIVAGVIDEGESAETSARREVEEEIGYSVDKLEFINNFYVSPGGSSERLFLYYVEVLTTDQVSDSRGIESEDIQLVKIKKSEIERMMKENSIIDAKTLIALQYYFLKY